MNTLTYHDALVRLDTMMDDLPDWWDDPLWFDLAQVICDKMYEILAVGEDEFGHPENDISALQDQLEDWQQAGGRYSYLFSIYSDIVYTFLHGYLLEDDGNNVLEGWSVPHE